MSQESMRINAASPQPLWNNPNNGLLIRGDARASEPAQKTAPQPAMSPAEQAKLKKACQDFESFFLSYLMKQMRSTVPAGGFVKDSRPTQLYQEMQDEAVAARIAQSPNSMGLSNMLYKTISEQQLKRVYHPDASDTK